MLRVNIAEIAHLFKKLDSDTGKILIPKYSQEIVYLMASVKPLGNIIVAR